MMYFKTIAFPACTTQPAIENALRKSAIKKTTVLDFKKSTIDMGRDKDFLGFEGKTSLSFTRTKTSLAFLLPKLIISLPKDQLATCYKIRLSAVPFAIFLVICFGILTACIGLLKGIVNPEAISLFFTGGILFVLLLAIELKITQATVVNCINNYKKPTDKVTIRK